MINNFTLIGGFNPAFINKHIHKGLKAALAIACNNDPDRKVVITEHIGAIPDTPMCALPYEVRDKAVGVNKDNFLKANWVCLDVDNQDLPDDKKWTQEKIFNCLAELEYNFRICGSITDGNYKVFIECEECNDVVKYEYFNNKVNTMIDGLGDPNYQGKLTFVKGYICRHDGGKLFTCDYDDAKGDITDYSDNRCGDSNKVKKIAPAANMGEFGADKDMTKWDKERYRKLYKEFKNAETIRGRCMNLVPQANGTVNLHLEDEKTKGGYFIRPEKSIYIYKSGAGKVKYTPEEFFIDDKTNKRIYTLLRELNNGGASIKMMMQVDKEMAIETICEKKIIRNDLFRKVGCKCVERDSKGKWNLTFFWQGVAYYSNCYDDMVKLIKRLWDKIKNLINDRVSMWIFALFNKNGTQEQCTNNVKDINISLYKGRTEEQITNNHNRMMTAIKKMMDKAKQVIKYHNPIEIKKCRDKLKQITENNCCTVPNKCYNKV